MAVSKATISLPFVPDDRQREAIEHVHGPMLVVAGAGTGKTSVLIHRIARLVQQGTPSRSKFSRSPIPWLQRERCATACSGLLGKTDSFRHVS